MFSNGLTEFTLTNMFLKSFDTYILLAEIVRLLGPVLFEILCTFELLTFEMPKNQIMPYHPKSEGENKARQKEPIYFFTINSGKHLWYKCAWRASQ